MLKRAVVIVIKGIFGMLAAVVLYVVAVRVAVAIMSRMGWL